MKATRAMELLGMIIVLGALVCAILSLSVMKSQTLLPRVAGGCAIAAGKFCIRKKSHGALALGADIWSDLHS